MKRRNFVFFSIGLIFVGCKTDQSSADNNAGDFKVELRCEERSGTTEDTPAAGVFAVVNTNKTKIANINACDLIEADVYPELGIPTDALMAVGGWWAGSGDYFYAQKGEKNEILFYHGVVDEMSETPRPVYEVIAAFRNGSFHFQH